MDDNVSLASSSYSNARGRPGELFMPPSYPMPYQRTNLGPDELKRRPFFFNDSTGFNPSDPRSLGNQGKTMNGLYNPNVAPGPDGTKLVRSNVPRYLGTKGPTPN